MAKLLQLIYAGVAYVLFLATFLYAIGFVVGVGVPKSIDSGPAGPLVPSLVIDALLLGLFAVQHTLMARPGFKAWWTKIVPAPIERSTYVVLSSLLLILLFWQWRALPGTVWALQGGVATAVYALCALGWLTVLASTFMISHFELFGLVQAYSAFRDRAAPALKFHTPMLYGLIRHPIMAGFIIAFWAVPVMSVGHLVFAFATTAYILIALQFEEHDLVAMFGQTYVDYRRRVPMLIPFLRLPSASAPTPKAADHP